MNIALSMKKCMKAKDWNQGELAEKMGVTGANISTMMRRGSCNSDTIEKLADVFGMKASEFIAAGEQ